MGPLYGCHTKRRIYIDRLHGLSPFACPNTIFGIIPLRILSKFQFEHVDILIVIGIAYVLPPEVEPITNLQNTEYQKFHYM